MYKYVENQHAVLYRNLSICQPLIQSVKVAVLVKQKINRIYLCTVCLSNCISVDLLPIKSSLVLHKRIILL